MWVLPSRTQSACSSLSIYDWSSSTPPYKTTDMTSSVTRRPVRTGGSCLLKRIVVLGDDPFVRLLLLLLLFASARLWLASDSSL